VDETKVRTEVGGRAVVRAPEASHEEVPQRLSVQVVGAVGHGLDGGVGSALQLAGVKL